MDKKILYNLLLRSLDETLTESEQQQLQEGLSASAELRAEKEKLLKMRAMLSNQAKAYDFKPFFEGRVMEKIRTQKAPFNQTASSSADFLTALIWSFQRMAVPSFALICIMLIYVYSTADTLSLQAIMGISDIAPEDLKFLNI